MDGQQTTACTPLFDQKVEFLRRKSGELVLANRDHEYTFTPRDAEVLLKARPLFSGIHSVAEVASRSEVDPEHLGLLVDVLLQEQLALDLALVQTTCSADDFIPLYRRLCQSWAMEMSRHPFWVQLSAGKAPIALVMRWAVETYHYVRSANDHMSASVAHCMEDYEARRWFAQHYVDEHAHDRIFLKGLERCGLSKKEVQSSTPLASTSALTNYLTELAITDRLAYAGSYGIMRGAEPETEDSVAEFHDFMTKSYPEAAGFFDAVRDHTLIDLKAGHEELVLEKLLRRQGTIEPREAGRVLRAARRTADYFCLMFGGVLDHYGLPEATVSRRAADIRVLM